MRYSVAGMTDGLADCDASPPIVIPKIHRDISHCLSAPADGFSNSSKEKWSTHLLVPRARRNIPRYAGRAAILSELVVATDGPAARVQTNFPMS
jgi:hypothetical protein